MKLIIPFIIILFFQLPLLAQQRPIFNQYREHQILSNPASMSSDQFGPYQPLDYIGLSGRYQWFDVNPSPYTMVTHYEKHFEDNGVLLGGSIMQDATGPNSMSGAYIRYAYKLPLDGNGGFNRPSHYLNIGANIGLIQHRYNPAKGTLRDPNDLVGSTAFNRMMLDLSLGIFYFGELGSSDNYVYAGLSATQIPKGINLAGKNKNGNFIEKTPHYYFNTGTYLNLADMGSGRMYLEPSVWIKYVFNSPLQTDFNLRYNIGRLWLGGGASVSYGKITHLDMMHLEFGVPIPVGDNTMKIGFGYDKQISSFGDALGSAIEINLSYSWGESYGNRY